MVNLATGDTLDSPPRRRGRRPAGEDTRGVILDAARRLFISQGYDATSLRAIARAAGVDPSLVHHYFAGKAQLFATAIAEVSDNPAALIGRMTDGDPDALGVRMVSAFLGIWDASASFEGLLRGMMSTDAGVGPFREFLVGEILTRISELATPSEPERRAELVASQMIGLAIARYVFGLPWLASAPPDEIGAAVGPCIQRYLTAPLAPVSQPARDAGTRGTGGSEPLQSEL